MTTTATTLTTPAPVTLTARQLEVLEFIADYWLEHLAPPTLRDIQKEFGFGGPNGARCHVLALTRHGLLVPAPEGGPRLARSLVVAGLRDAVAGAAEAHLRGLLARHGGGD